MSNSSISRFPFRLAFLMAIAIPNTASIKADEATKQRFLNEYPTAAKFMRDKFANVVCEYVQEYDQPGTSRHVKSEYRYYRSEGREKVEGKTLITKAFHAPTEAREVLCVSQGSTFGLVSRDQEQNYAEFPSADRITLGFAWNILSKSHKPVLDAIFLLHHAAMGSRDTEFIDRFMNETIAPNAFQGLTSEGFAGWMKHPSFELLDAEPVADDPDLIEIRFRTQHPTPLEIVARLDTGNHWALTQIRTGNVGMTSSPRILDIEYGAPVEGVAWPVSVGTQGQPPIRLTRWSFEPTPASEFDRAHYGVSEPVASLRIWLMFVGMTTAILGMPVLAFWYLMRRRKKSMGRMMPRAAAVPA